MRTRRELYSEKPIVYTCELDTCLQCGEPMEVAYVSGSKTVQTMTDVLTIAQRTKHCVGPECTSRPQVWKSARWQQIAPSYCTYGYDVIARIGWERQVGKASFEGLHASLASRFPISEAQVRYLYHSKYLPLLACHERQNWGRLQAVAEQLGLVLSLDGLAPEGGEPQLWVVRDLLTGLTLRSGWMSQQDQAAFVNFLWPIRESGLRVEAVMSDKQRGLVPAVAEVFPHAKHGFCQTHYLKNATAPVAEADEAMKVTLRKQVRQEIGALIRQDKEEQAGVLTVTGLLPSPVEEPKPPLQAGECPQPPSDPIVQERETIVQDLLRRVRYLLTLKGRPPFRLAGLDMVERLTEVETCVERLLQHQADPRLRQLQQGLHTALHSIQPDYADVRQAAGWLAHIEDRLDPDGKPARSGAQVHQELFAYLDDLQQETQDSPRLHQWCQTIYQTSLNYASGLFHCYDTPGLPRTNNDRESEFRDLNRRLLSTTGQKGLTRRLIQREGAWELIPHPSSLQDTITALSHVDPNDFQQEQQRIRTHRNRFRLHTRSARQSQAQLKHLEQRWLALPPTSGP
jgi:hypothetical protein